MNQMDTESEGQQILHHMAELESAENRKDIDAILALLAEDFLFVYGQAKWEGKAAAREMLQESARNYISSKHVPLRVEVSHSGDMAWLFGYELNQRARDTGIVETRQHYVITFRKDGDAWKQVAVCLA